MHEAWIDDVLQFWFDEVPAERRFARDAALDAQILARFAAVHERVAQIPVGRLDTPSACLAGVIVLDQFSRNMFRNTPQAFASDPLALAHSTFAIDRGLDQALTPVQRMFLYMPWQHAEDVAAQARSVQLFEALGIDMALRYAHEHQEVVQRFGRFPHRNAALGRASTPDEIEFMKTHPGF